MHVDPSFRASDEDRERLAAILREQLVAGRLTNAEFDERVAAAFAATTWDDLRMIIRDLPVTVRFADERSAPPAPSHQVRRTPPVRRPRLLPIAVVCLVLILGGERLLAVTPLIVFGGLIAIIAIALGWTRRS